jgi:hypothetical protein
VSYLQVVRDTPLAMAVMHMMVVHHERLFPGLFAGSAHRAAAAAAAVTAV